MQSVDLLRQRFSADSETLKELAAIADRIEKLAATADLSKSIRSPPGRNSAAPDAETASSFTDGSRNSHSAD